MTGLKKNTEYSFRVVANNKHGSGVSTEDITVRTLSDGRLWLPINNALLISVSTLVYFLYLMADSSAMLNMLSAFSAKCPTSKPDSRSPELKGKAEQKGSHFVVLHVFQCSLNGTIT